MVSLIEHWPRLRPPGQLQYTAISHESQDAADKNWRAFQADSDWMRVMNASEADGKILAKAPDRVFMRLTEYSPGK